MKTNGSSTSFGLQKFRTFFFAAAIFLSAASANATYSIVAANSTSRQVGIAMASCVEFIPLWLVVGSAPGSGFIVAQSAPNFSGRDVGQQGLLFGATTEEILGYISNPGFDPQVTTRQYGVVSVDGNPGAFTGSDNTQYAGDKQGTVGVYKYSVQGNTLTSDKVITQAAQAFENHGCDLADKLMLALEAAGKNGEGDNRCTGSGRPASRAYLQVDLPDSVPGSYLAIETGFTRDNPVEALRKKYDAWRKKNRCHKRGRP